MSTMITHRRFQIVTLADGESIAGHCRRGDIALMQDEAGWWAYFVGLDGELEGYDVPFDSYGTALRTVKAAAEIAAG